MGWIEKTAWIVTDLGGGDARFNKVLVADVDSDGADEIVVAGYASTAGTGKDAYLGIYHLSGAALVKEIDYSKDFDGGDDFLNGVVVLDYDNDGTEEIIVTGTAIDAHEAGSQEDIVVGILHVAGGSIVEETGWYVKDFEGAAARRNWGLDIAAGNVDGDADTELVVVSRDDLGAYVNTPMRVGVLSVSAGALTEETWFSEDPTGVLDYWTDVEIADLDGDNVQEIVVAGSYEVFWSSIGVAAYVKSGGSLVRESPIYTKRVGAQNNHAHDLVIGNVDDDAELEVVVAGNFDDSQVNTDYGDVALGVLRYSGAQFHEEVPWFHLDMGKACAGVSYSGSDALTAVAIDDLDGDGMPEIAAAGYATGDCTKYDVLVGAFEVSGGALVQESDWYWKDMGGDEQLATSISAADLNGDGIGDVVLAGHHRPDSASPGDQIAVMLGLKLPPVRGRITVTSGGQVYPLDKVSLHLIPDDGGPVLATTTDKDGYYSFDFDPEAGVLYHVYAELRYGLWGDPDHYFMLYYQSESSDNACSVTNPDFAVDPGTVVVKDLDFADLTLSGTPNIPAGDREELALTYYYVAQVFDLMTTQLGVVPDYEMPMTVVAFSTGCPVADRNCYIYDGTAEVHIDDDQYIGAGWPENAEWHETFHHMMQDTITIPERDSGDTNHGGYENSNTKDSWTEGWATFWPLVLADTLPLDQRPYDDPYMYNGTSLEMNWKAWYEQDGAGGQVLQREDRAVASLLWDLYDGNSDCGNLTWVYRDVDHCDYVDLSLAQIWGVIGNTSINALRDMKDVYDAFAAKGHGQGDQDGDGMDDLDEIFVLHGFFADTNDNGIYNPGEEIGRAADGARPDRRSVPLVSGAFIKANFEDPDGNPMANNMLKIEVSFPSPGEAFSYDYGVQVAEATGSLVYVELPPEVYSTTLKLHPVGGFPETDLVLEGSDYWQAVHASTTGYALEHTFIVEHKIYLPLTVR
jgi:hypothetical protein